MILNNSRLQIYGEKQSDDDKGDYKELIFCGDLYNNKSGYPQIVIVQDDGKTVSILLNEGNDFVSVEFHGNRVRDVFCLLMRRIKQNSK